MGEAYYMVDKRGVKWALDGRAGDTGVRNGRGTSVIWVTKEA